MKIPFNTEREISTSELPGVVCHPALIFHFDAAPSVDFMRDLSLWSQTFDNLEAIKLAAMLIKGVSVFEDNEPVRYELGTPDSIADLIKQTNEDFIVGLLRGWHAYIQTERLAELGKLKALSTLLLGNAQDPTRNNT